MRPLDHPGNSPKSHRHAINAQRPSEYGGGRCTLLVRRLNDQIELLFHATPQTGAIMTPAQAVEVAKALIAAAENPATGKPINRRITTGEHAAELAQRGGGDAMNAGIGG